MATDLLQQVLEHARRYRESLSTRPLRPRASLEELRRAFAIPLPETGEDAGAVLDVLAKEGEPGLMGSSSPRFFGFVIGGAHPAAIAADWLTSAWDQNSALHLLSPTVAVLEETAGRWLCELFGLPLDSGVGFVTGAQMANFTALAAARHEHLSRVGWNVEDQGLYGAPELHVVVGAEAHVTVLRALRFLGLGQKRVKRVPVDGQGCMRADALGDVLKTCSGPTLVCLQAGHINTGGMDPFASLVEEAHRQDAWVHVDGAFGLWAAASTRRRATVRGVETADSWAVDAHKWLNVPYDCGVTIIRDAQALRAAMGTQASYLVMSEGLRDSLECVPEFSRRARGVPSYTMLRTLGRSGVEALVDHCCDLAQRMAAALSKHRAVTVLNDVLLNQVLVCFTSPDGGDADDFTRQVIARVQEEGTCWVGGAVWQGRQVMRISVSGWSTTNEDADRSVDAILRCLR